MTDLEMAQLWAEIIDVDQVEVDDHFFEIGGNSLLAIEVVRELKERAGVALPLGEFLRDPRPRAVSEALALAAGRTNGESAVV